MRLLDPRVLVHRIVRSRRAITVDAFRLRRGQLEACHGPGLRDLADFLQTINIVRVGLNAEAGKDVCIECLEDLAAVGLDLG
jgi:hypothetical protein